MAKSYFGVIGLGVMGRSLSLNIAGKGYSLSVFNRASHGEESVVDDFLNLAEEGMLIDGFTNLNDFVESLEQPRKILLMINAGKAIDEVIELLLPFLSEDDIIIDGGNSYYRDTRRRSDYLESKGIDFIGVGISGGEEGARKGPSIMPGGSKSGYKIIAPVLESIAATDHKGSKCCTYIGPDGAGHFVKMVHNGIEYGEMQLLAEMYSLLSISKSNEEIKEIFLEWNRGCLSGYLLEITAEIMTKKENDNYLLDLILDKAENKGTGSWSTKEALDTGSVNTMMSSAVFARYVSYFKSKRVKLSKTIPKTVADTNVTISIDELKKAYIFARIINHRQGFELIRLASDSYNWNLCLSELSRIWTNGCIIRSELMVKCISYFQSCEDLFEHSEIIETLKNNEEAMRKLLIYGIDHRVPMETFSASNNHWISMTTERLAANLIQAQRDYFGSHTYQRIDAEENQYFHTNWQIK
jgi:6-phosphogluconate dehydrogenase